jgi:hypothetical protein
MGIKAFKAFWHVDYPEAYKKLTKPDQRTRRNRRLNDETNGPRCDLFIYGGE